MKSQLYTEKSNFTFWSKSCVKDHNSSKHVKILKPVHQEIKKSRFHFEKSKFLNLEIFRSVGKFIFFLTLSQIYTMMQNDSNETSNMKVVDLNEI